MIVYFFLSINASELQKHTINIHLTVPQYLSIVVNIYERLMAKKHQPETLDEAFSLINDELLATFIQKHKDYGKGNILSLKELGIAYRISEKTERLKNLLMQGNDPTNESIEDSWTDIAVYAILARLYKNGQFQSLEISDKEK